MSIGAKRYPRFSQITYFTTIPMLEKKELENDILRYNELLKRSEELEKDIPPRREPKRPAKPAKAQVKEVKVKKEPAKVKVKTEPKGTRRQPPRKSKVAVKMEEEEEEIARKPSIPQRKRPKPKAKEEMRNCPKRIKYFLSHRPVKKEEHEEKHLRLKVRSFEDHISVTLSYSDLIQAVKEDEGKTLDFGMLMNLLPKNIAFEKKRFEFGSSSEFDSVLDRRHSFNDDIDRFFRQISDGGAFTASSDVPLV